MPRTSYHRPRGSNWLLAYGIEAFSQFLVKQSMADSPERRNVRTFSDAALYSEHSTEQFSGFDMIKNEGMPDGQQRHRKDTDTGHFGGDGAFDQVLKRRKGPVGAIFIHAGAGYHSTTNERVHLAACSE